MNKFRWFLIFVLVAAAFAVGVYFSNEVKKGIQDFQKSDIGQTVTQAAKQIFAPPPLNRGGFGNANVVLLKSKIIEETNLQRQQNGNLPALKENVKLNNAALAKANDMFSNQYFEHVSPSGVGPSDLVQRYGYDYILAGENLILGNFASEKEVVQSWMDSPGHRANILNNRYTEIGVAIIKGTYNGQTVWISVQEFGLPMSSCSAPDSNLKKEIDILKTQLEILSLQIDAKKIEIENTNKKSAAYKQMVDDYNQLIAQYNSLTDQAKNLIATYNNQVNIFNQCVNGQ